MEVSPCKESLLIKDETMKNQYKTGESTEETFSWSLEFSKDLCQSISNQNHTILLNLLRKYIKNVSEEAVECNQKPKLAAELSNHINRTLTFFYFYWLDIKEQCDDQVTNLYLNKISDLLSIYLEIKLPPTNLFNTIFINLENSTEHVLRVLLNAKLSKLDHSIYEPIFSKCFSKSTSLTATSYV
ncbi:hypothetical protein KQX54_017922 [Cotesia glomerata]|uniref:Uncharacterized protein n=1 Tax=Cotesia glomerata TaxID=32391 RepID=A0AAV7HYA7_COTGL|nr:hypothetical protein KQX54_017922 [Cotesia glomerata]